jgi:hypothetical protein
MGWSPRRKKWVLLGAVAGTALFAVALVLLFVPISQESSGYTMVGAHLYSYESEALFGDGNGWNNYSYRGVTFGFSLVCGPPNPGGPTICGNATAADGVPHAYEFGEVGPPRDGPGPWQTWVAADAHEAVEFQPGGFVHLLVAV